MNASTLFATGFTPAPPMVMHVDINSCFATIEQQARPHLRGKPVAVAAYAEDRGCILAASVEAKRVGVKTGMRVREGKYVCPSLVVLPPDPKKYRFVNKQLTALLSSYTPNLSVESIDEMVLSLEGTPALASRLNNTAKAGDGNETLRVSIAMRDIAREMKERIKREIGEWIRVSVGIAPNRYLAKVASGLHKPDGLDVITKDTIQSVLAGMALADLCGIKEGNIGRLRTVGITTPSAFFAADRKTLVRAFRSVVGGHWWLRLHGWEDGSRYTGFGSKTADEDAKSIGHSFALSKFLPPGDDGFLQIVSQLVIKMGKRVREGGFTAGSTDVFCLFADGTSWHDHVRSDVPLFTDGDFFTHIRLLLAHAPAKSVRLVAVSCHSLTRDLYRQTALFGDDRKKEDLTRAVDAVNTRFGLFTVVPARLLNLNQQVLDRIAFGKTKGA